MTSQMHRWVNAIGEKGAVSASTVPGGCRCSTKVHGLPGRPPG
jgi:hypothetical protein